MNPELYFRVREKEGRLYSDEIVANLPSIPAGHPLANEWLARCASASHLTRYLSSQPRSLFILDLGCGNGWLSNLLSNSGHNVIGLDQNRYELKQARRVFKPNSRLSFLEGDIFSAPFIARFFDVIILASVLQYFQDVPGLMSVLLTHLQPRGEIHILDTPLYSEGELDAAVLRSRQYYSSLGFPEMAGHYFHHCKSDLDAFHPKRLYDPQALALRVKRWLGWVDSPFPWIFFKKQDAE